LHLVGILFPHFNDDARSKSLQMGFKVQFLVYWKQDASPLQELIG